MEVLRVVYVQHKQHINNIRHHVKLALPYFLPYLQLVSATVYMPVPVIKTAYA